MSSLEICNEIKKLNSQYIWSACYDHNGGRILVSDTNLKALKIYNPGMFIHDIHDVIFIRKQPKQTGFLPLVANLNNLNNRTSGKHSVFFERFRMKDEWIPKLKITSMFKVLKFSA